MAVVKTILNPAENKNEEKKPVLQSEVEKPVIPATEPKKEMTMMEKILKIENLQLVIEKRAKRYRPAPNWIASRSHPMTSTARYG